MKNSIMRSLVIVAPPAELKLENCRVPLLPIVEVPAVLVVLNEMKPVELLVMPAEPAELVSWKLTVPLLTIVAVAAVLVPLNSRLPLLLMVADPAVLS